MSENQRNQSDQADELRKRLEQQSDKEQNVEVWKAEVEMLLGKAAVGTLPPRSSIHKKPPVNVTPYYVAGIVGLVLLLMLVGLGFWWNTSRSQSSVAQPLPKAGESPAKKEASAPPAVKPAAPSQSTTASKPAAQPPVNKPVSTPVAPQPNKSASTPAAPQPSTGTSVKPAASSQPPVKPAASKVPAAKAAATVKKAPVKNQRRILRHRVQKGDTLYALSVMYYGTGKYQFYLARYNGIRQLNAGSVIKVPIPPR